MNSVKNHSLGFALPTVLIASVVALSILVTAVGATVAVRSSINQQRYDQLASTAAEAGTVYAQACLRINDNTVTWSDEKPLRPNTDCNGDPQADLSAYVLQNDSVRTYFVVKEPAVLAGYMPISSASQGFVEVLRGSTGTTWRIFRSNDAMALNDQGGGVPTGTSIEGHWTEPPEGYLLEDGSAVSRVTYAALFAVISTRYGAGDGSTTFNLPNSSGRTSVTRSSADTEFDVLGETGGAKTHTLSVAEMPSHTHTQNSHNHTQNAHTHTQNSHNHTQNSHNHTQNAHSHASNPPFVIGNSPVGNGISGIPGGVGAWGSYGSAHWFQTESVTAANQAATATNVAVTATNQNTTATNNATTATNQNTGSGSAHNNLQPYITVNRAIKY